MAGKVGSADAAKPVTSETMAAKTVGLQIYSLGKELYADVPGGLKKIKQMGYTNLELAGYKEGKIGGVDMMEFKKMVDDAGLKITSSHVILRYVSTRRPIAPRSPSIGRRRLMTMPN